MNPTSPDRPRFSWLEGWPLASVLYLILVVVATWPVAQVFTERFAGDAYGDFWKHAWGHWWVRDSLVQGILPLFCRLVNAPAGGYLFVADPFNCLAVGLLLSVFPLVTAYNLLILGNLWAGCMAAWALARHVVHSAPAALAAGAVYGLSAYVLAYPVTSGVTETLNTAWMPLCILFMHRSVETRRFRDLLLAGFFFFLTTFSCWYYGQFMVVYAAFMLAARGTGVFRAGGPLRWRWRTWRQREAMLEQVRSRMSKALLDLRDPLFRIVAGLALGTCLVFPFALVFQLVVSDPANIVMPDKAPSRSLLRFQDFLGSNSPWSVSARGVRGFHNHTNLAGFFLPGKGNATVTVTIDRLTRVHYLGWVALGLAILAWKRRGSLDEGDRSVQGYWLATGLFFLVLSLGPVVTFSDFSSHGVFSPFYHAMYWLFPMFHKLAIPFRFLALSLLALGILAAMGLRWLSAGLSRWDGLGLSVLVAGACVLEVTLLSPAPWPLPTSPASVPAFYEMVATDPEEYGLIDYPFERPESLLLPGEFFYYQTVHRRPIPYRTSGVLSPEVARNSFMEEVRNAQTGAEHSVVAGRRLREGAVSLRAMGFRYLILHTDLLVGPSQEQIEEALIPILGEPARFADGLVVFELSELPEPGTQTGKAGGASREE
jgi:hypothetical protein